MRWYAAYLLRLRHIDETMAERGAFVDLAAVHGWAIKILPVFAVLLRKCKRQLGTSWPLHETYIDVAGQWTYLSALRSQ